MKTSTALVILALGALLLVAIQLKRRPQPLDDYAHPRLAAYAENRWARPLVRFGVIDTAGARMHRLRGRAGGVRGGGVGLPDPRGPPAVAAGRAPGGVTLGAAGRHRSASPFDQEDRCPPPHPHPCIWRWRRTTR